MSLTPEKIEELKELEWTKKWYLDNEAPSEMRDWMLPLVGRSMELLTGSPALPPDPELPPDPNPDKPTLQGKIALLVGHNSRRTGAWVVGDGISESEFAFHNKVADIIIEKGLGDIEFRRFNRTYGGGYSSEINRAYSQIDAWGADLVNDMHFNGGSGNYGMVMYHHASKVSQRVANAMANVFSAQLGIPDNRNASSREDHQNLVKLTSGENGYYSMARAKCPSVLWEPFFGDNRAHAHVIGGMGHEGYADICLDALAAGINAVISEG